MQSKSSMLTDPVDLIQPKVFEAHGLGWIYRPRDIQVDIVFDRVRESRDEISAEIVISHRNGGVILRRRKDLMGDRTVSGLTKELEEDNRTGEPLPWRHALRVACENVIAAFRKGAPLETLEGEIEKPRPIHWRIDQLLMENVVNCIVASAGTGKSTFAKAAALHIALGVDFLGHRVTKGIPLYLDYEDSYDNFKRTMYEINQGLGGGPIPKVYWQRGTGPLRGQVHEIAAKITRLGITDIFVDSVAAAGGAMGDRSYEAVAMEIEQAVVAIPPVSWHLLDHITGDEMKDNAIPMKARGSARKYEFVRYQWTLVLDREQAERGNHIVGWTHTKSNITRRLPPFAVQIYHDEDRITFGPVNAVDVAPLADRMTLARRCIEEITKAMSEGKPGLTVRELALLIRGDDSKKDLATIQKVLARECEHNRQLQKTHDGLWTFGGKTNVLRMPYQDDSDLPF